MSGEDVFLLHTESFLFTTCKFLSFTISFFGPDENGQIMRNDKSVGGGEPLPKLMISSNCWSTILLSTQAPKPQTTIKESESAQNEKW